LRNKNKHRANKMAAQQWTARLYYRFRTAFCQMGRIAGYEPAPEALPQPVGAAAWRLSTAPLA
jgi:hypothetical protein